MSTRVITLNKSGHQFVFQYARGFEQDVVEELTELADDPKSELDWLDVANLSFQLARNAGQDCRKVLTIESREKD